jgi:hypothetical protein
LLPGKGGWGQFQPFVRYQKFERDVSNTSNKALDLGVNYIINGANAKMSLMYTKFDDSRSGMDPKQFVVGVQVQV